jgi:hypothetical protein
MSLAIEQSIGIGLVGVNRPDFLRLLYLPEQPFLFYTESRTSRPDKFFGNLSALLGKPTTSIYAAFFVKI